MAIPRSSADYYQRQQRILVLLIAAIRRVWRRMDANGRWDQQYADDGLGAQMVMLIGAAQVAAARDADIYIAAVLAELDLVPDAAPGVALPAAFAGAAGDGRSVESLMGLVIPRAGQRFAELSGVSSAALPLEERPEWLSDQLWESLERERVARFEQDVARNRDVAATQALAEAERWLTKVAATATIDAARAAESAAMVSHPEVGGWVRMLNPPSCSRCAVLAGRFYRWNEGFERHPLCDCRHIPASESSAGDMTVNPDAYFRSLGREDQDRLFTKAGAEAIRDGADISQVVNARRSMEKAQVFGRDVTITREGITRFGQYGRSRGDFEKQRKRRYQASRHVRLMPESLYQIADGNRAEAVRLLRLHGYIL